MKIFFQKPVFLSFYAIFDFLNFIASKRQQNFEFIPVEISRPIWAHFEDIRKLNHPFF